MSTTSPLIDFHTHLWWWPDHLTDEFVDEGLAAKRVKMTHTPDVFFSSDDRHALDATPEMHRRDTAEADLCVVVGFSAEHLGVHVPNEVVAEYVASDAERLVGFAGIEPASPTAIDDLRRAHHELGLRGIKASPVYQNFDPTDRSLWDFYAEAERLDLPLLLHQGTTFPRRAPLRWANPLLIEDVALAFPRLRIVIAHLGHPWEEDAVVVLRKQPSVFADVSALHYRPWRFWQAMVTAKEYGVLHKLLLASDYPSATLPQVIAGLRSVNDIVEGTRLPQIPDEAIEAIVWENWRNFLRDGEWTEAPTSRKRASEHAPGRRTGNAELADRARRVIPGGVNSGQRQLAGLEDLVVVSTRGATFTDADGRVFTDYHAAFGPPLLGHNDPDVDRAAAEAARTNDLVGVGVTPVEVELAERICDAVPSVERVLLTSTGSEATFHALRVARAATGRRHVVKFQGCYHGWHDSVALNVISAAERVGAKDPLSKGILPEVLDATIVCPFNDADAVERALTDHDVAAVILEPVPHNVGCLLPRAGFLERLRELCTRYGTVLVFDEVITGFRHAMGGYQSLAGVLPDLTTLGKSMGNGYPISALGGRAALMDLFSTTPGQPAFFAGTFNGHPGTTAAALATIEKLGREPVHEHVFRLGDLARTGLEQLYRRLDVDAVVSGLGSVFVTYFLEDPVERYDDLLRNDVDLFVGYRRELLREGIFELPLNLKRSHFSYAHTEDDVARLVEATERAVGTVLERREVGLRR